MIIHSSFTLGEKSDLVKAVGKLLFCHSKVRDNKVRFLGTLASLPLTSLSDGGSLRERRGWGLDFTPLPTCSGTKA